MNYKEYTYNKPKICQSLNCKRLEWAMARKENYQWNTEWKIDT